MRQGSPRGVILAKPLARAGVHVLRLDLLGGASCPTIPNRRQRRGVYGGSGRRRRGVHGGCGMKWRGLRGGGAFDRLIVEVFTNAHT